MHESKEKHHHLNRRHSSPVITRGELDEAMKKLSRSAKKKRPLKLKWQESQILLDVLGKTTTKK